MIRALILAAAGAVGLAAPAAAAAQDQCAVALVMAMDVSRSVSSREYDLQMNGLANAFRAPDVIDLIRAQKGGVMATVMIWGDETQQKQTTPWTLLTGGPELETFAAGIEQTHRSFGFTLTGLGAAMRFADGLLSENHTPCRRSVIDISGDGVWNDGPPPSVIWPTMARGITVNGLVILGATPDPYPYYRDEVIGGPGAFVETAADFDDYAHAIRLKLLRELSPALSMLRE
ncbi:DUF1194 domain-containing protein [Pikeienuella piscinae]|uniref:DUF1194 domain-containing protein n=1 Tax=Pikeienuella piscinae TaxID=2748098 RepID=A0A7L5C076_9RHOB|nr:DUF1194 domain-containing protein [Pikeienuella piscinae]QIE56488.1 DUF1194 domain-containing protein [Pikeienuella piscinae]